MPGIVPTDKATFHVIPSAEIFHWSNIPTMRGAANNPRLPMGPYIKANLQLSIGFAQESLKINDTLEQSPPHPIPTMNLAIANSKSLREFTDQGKYPVVINRIPPSTKRQEQILKEIVSLYAA